VVQSELDIKTWLSATPSVDAVRPKRCRCCRSAGRPSGERLGIWGHGLRARQVRGPQQPGWRPQLVQVWVRRYLCLLCGAVMTVVPSAVARCRLYSVLAIGWALGLFGVDRLSSRRVREQVSPWPVVGAASAGRQWITLSRWVRAVAQRKLLPCIRPHPPEWTLRQVAERAATTLASFAQPVFRELPLAHQAAHGAVQVLMTIPP
jgi:hypothetical protein